MQTKIIDFNMKEQGFKFSLSAVSEKDWQDFAKSVVLEKSETAINVKDISFHAVIRDNVAKVKFAYQDKSYHELEYHIDEFGRASKNYQDVVSALWQGVMSKYYGKQYSEALENKIGTLKI